MLCTFPGYVTRQPFCKNTSYNMQSHHPVIEKNNLQKNIPPPKKKIQIKKTKRYRSCIKTLLYHFQGCSRILISRDLDLRHAVYVQFVFLFGCTAGPVTRNQGVLVDYSTDGGITWMPITELYYTLYRTPKQVNRTTHLYALRGLDGQTISIDCIDLL